MSKEAYSTLISRLQKMRAYKSPRADVAQAARACCPAHEDRSPSLSVALCDDGRILVHCHAGCAAHEVFDAVGLQIQDAAPDNNQFAYIKSGDASWHSIIAAAETAENALIEALVHKDAERIEQALWATEQLRKTARAAVAGRRSA